jgi:hypothetical protein
LLFALPALLVAAPASADEEGAGERTVVLGVGGAAELELSDGSVHPGGNVMVEWEAIEGWLELEADVSVLSADGGTVVPVALLAKKPFKLARWAEVMIGLGPEVVTVSTAATKGTFAGGEVALDFMFWPSRHLGFWVEPSYDLLFEDGLSHGVGATGGLLFGW